jgi:DNA-binding transcriptional MerR regulator
MSFFQEVLSMKETEWITLGQASRLAGVSAASIRNWDLAGQIESRQTPLGRLYRADSVIKRAKRPRSRRRKGEATK